jgi:WD40 repeat protein
VAGTAAVCAALGALAWFIWLGPALDNANEEAERHRTAAESGRKEADSKVKRFEKDLESERREHEKTKDDLKAEKDEHGETESKLKNLEIKVQDTDRRIREADGRARRAQEQLNQVAKTGKALEAKYQQAQQLIVRAQGEAYADRLALADLERTYRAPDRGASALMRCLPPQRGWEWHYLKGRVNAERYAFRPHDDLTTAVAYNPDGKRLATAGLDKAVRVWDALTGKLLVNFTAHTRPVTGLAWSRDGKRIASCDAGGKAPGQGEVKVWEADRGKVVHALACPAAAQAVAFAPDGRVAAGCINGSIKLWDADGKELPGPPAQDKGPSVNAVAFSPDGSLLAWGGGDFNPKAKPASADVKVWDAKGGQEVLSLKGHPATVLGLAFQPDGRRLISSDALGQLKVWDTATRKAGPALHTLVLATRGARGLAPAPDNRHLYVGAGDGHLWCVDLESGKPVRRYWSEPRGIMAVAIHPAGTRVVTAEGDKLAHVWDLREPPPFLTSAAKHEGAVTCLAVSPDDTLAASAGEDRKVRLWDLRTGRALRTLGEELARPVVFLQFSPDGSRLVGVGRPSAQADKAIEVFVWDTATGKKVAEVPDRSGEALYVAFGPDGKRLLVASPGKELLIWDLATRKAVERLDDRPGSPVAGTPADCLAATPDGKWLALAGRNGITMTRLMPGVVGEEWRMSPLFKAVQGMGGLVWSPRGNQLGLAVQGRLFVWNMNPRKPLGNWQLARPDPRTVALAPDGRRLFGGLGTREVKVWEMENPTGNHLLLNLRGAPSVINCVACGGDGRRLVAGLADGSLVIWDADAHSEPDGPGVGGG